LWLASAFGGHGLNTTAMAGELIAGAITDGDDRWRLFLPYELVWAGGALGRAVHRVATWSRRGSENWVASLSRRREAARRAEAAQVRPEQAGPAQVALSPVVPRQAAPPQDAPRHVAPRQFEPPQVAPSPVARPEPAGVEPTIAEIASTQVPEVESLLGQVAERANRQKARRPDAQKGKTPRRTQGAAPNGPTNRTALGGAPGRQVQPASPAGEAEPPAVSKDPPSTD
jgi:hypothetical protein